MAVRPLDDVMRYYHFTFIPLYVFVFVAALITFAGIRHPKILKYSVIVNILAGFSILCEIFFFGILADNQAPNLDFWFPQLIVMAFICLALILIQFIVEFLKAKK